MGPSALSDAGEVSGRDADTETETIDTIDSVANAGRDQVSFKRNKEWICNLL